MLRPIFLVALCVGLQATETPPATDAVTNVRVVQEGFEGMVSVRWETPAGFPNTIDDTFLVNITDVDGELVGRNVRYFGDNVASAIVENFKIGEPYNVTIIPLSQSKEVEGQSAMATIIFKKNDTVLLAPSVLNSTRLDIDFIQLSWDDVDNVAKDDEQRWFFVRVCAQPDESYCVHVTTSETSVAVSSVHLSETSDVQIFAHVSGANGTAPVRSSNAFVSTVEVKPWNSYAPENVVVRPDYENALLDIIPYTITWSNPPFESLIFTTIWVYDYEGSKIGPPYVAIRVGSNETSASVPLDYDKPFDVMCGAVYNRSGSETAWTNVTVRTPEGFSNPVRNLRASQDGHSAKVVLTWAVPRAQNGRIDFYDVRIKAVQGGQQEQQERVKISEKKATVEIKAAVFGTEYEFSVTPVRERPGRPAVAGQIAVTRLTLEKDNGGGLSPWVIVLIVLIVLAVIGGGAFYFLKMRNRR